MKKVRIAVILLIVVSLFAACSQPSQAPETSTPQVSPSPAVETTPTADVEVVVADSGVKITDILPDLNDTTAIGVGSIGVGSNIFGGSGAYAIADDAQIKRIIDALSTIDLSSFEVCERTGTSGLSQQLIIENESGGRTVKLLSPAVGLEEEDFIYICMPAFCEDGCLAGDDAEAIEKCMERIENESFYFMGPRGEFSFTEFASACTAVLSDDTDLQNTAVVSWLDGREPEHVLVKGNWACVRYVFDGVIATTEPPEATNDSDFDVEVVAGDNTYLLDTITGKFAREQGGETETRMLDEQWYTDVCARLGVLDI